MCKPWTFAKIMAYTLKIAGEIHSMPNTREGQWRICWRKLSSHRNGFGKKVGKYASIRFEAIAVCRPESKTETARCVQHGYVCLARSLVPLLLLPCRAVPCIFRFLPPPPVAWVAMRRSRSRSAACFINAGLSTDGRHTATATARVVSAASARGRALLSIATAAAWEGGREGGLGGVGWALRVLTDVRQNIDHAAPWNETGPRRWIVGRSRTSFCLEAHRAHTHDTPGVTHLHPAATVINDYSDVWFSGDDVQLPSNTAAQNPCLSASGFVYLQQFFPLHVYKRVSEWVRFNVPVNTL